MFHTIVRALTTWFRHLGAIPTVLSLLHAIIFI